jgi:hypothetical protein
MDLQLFSLLTDPRLLEIVLCLGVIGLLRWISLMG